MTAAFATLPAHAHGEKKNAAAPVVFEQTAWGIAGKRADARRTSPPT